MSALEKQTAPCAVGGAFSGAMAMAAVRDPGTARPVGDPIEAREGKQWFIARIAGVQGDQVKVHWMDAGWDLKVDESWLPLSEVRSIEVPRTATGPALEALPGGIPQA